MNHKQTLSFRRVLAMLLCIAMLSSYIVLPVSAESAVADAVPTQKATVTYWNVNYYAKNADGTDAPFLLHTNWLQHLADNSDTNLLSFLQTEGRHYVDLMPVEGKLVTENNGWQGKGADKDVSADFDADGTVKMTNLSGYWPYGDMTGAVVIDLNLTPYLYLEYSGDAEFNFIFTYNSQENGISAAAAYNGSNNLPSGKHSYFVDIKSYMANLGVTGKITLDEWKYYVVGNSGTYVDLTDVCFVSSQSHVTGTDTTNDLSTGVYLDDYTALIVEYMGTGKSDVEGADGVEYFVDAVIDCGVDFDEEPHQIKTKTDYGFVFYIPDSMMSGLEKKPERGDLVNASFDYANWEQGSLVFYENPTNTLTHAQSTDVNATVKLFNYDDNIIRDGFNFWNGFWGWGANVESVDGSGVENGYYRFPTPTNTLSSAGYPQLDNGNGGTYDLDYLFNGSSTRLDGTSTLIDTMQNGGGLFQMDADGYYYYDSMQNAAYYDETTGKFVLMEDLIVRPWYNSSNGNDYKYSDIYSDYADVNGSETAYGNFLPFNKITSDNITVDGGVYYNAEAAGRYDADGNLVYNSIHTVDETYTAFRKAVGSLERYGLSNTAADKVLAGTKAMDRDAYQEILAANGGDVMSARLEEKLDMGFGMTVDFDFYMSQNGKVNGEDMEFDFHGDDDVFVYVGIWNGSEYDYRLVLDISGIHEAKTGNINFATGAVEDWPSASTSARTGRTLYQIFMDADGDGTVSETEAAGENARYFNGETFADFTKLSLKFFYLERGGNISYCRLRFNMPTLPENSLTVGKALNVNALGSQTYQFRVLKAELNSETGLYEATDELFIPEGTFYTVAGTGTRAQVGEDGYFTLTPGQSVTFDDILSLSEGVTHYVVEETITQDVNSQFTIESPTCSINGVSVGVTKLSGEDGEYIYRTDALAVDVNDSALARSETMQIVGFTNLVDESVLGTLKITKKIAENSNIDKDASFNMRVTVGGALLPTGTTYDIIDAATGDMISEDVKVTTKGVVTLKAGQTVVIDRILSTSTFHVAEISHNAAPEYSSTSEGVTCNRGGASGTMPLNGEISILVINDDSSGLTVDKTVEAGEAKDEFVLNLEAFATGETTTVMSTTPADIVLVLDQSASMYTPKGANADSFNRWYSQNSNTNLTKLNTYELSTAKGAKVGYYVAQTKELNRTVAEGSNDYNGNGSTGEKLNIYDWFIVQYVENVGWVYVRVDSTHVPVTVDPVGYTAYVSGSGTQYGATVVNPDGPNAETGLYDLIPGFNYYESQYSALYESVTSFVDQLKETGIDHRVAVTGFSSPYYDGIDYYNGSGLYIGSDYYLYDISYRYMGYATTITAANPHGYILYVPDEYYDSMESILPADLEDVLWSRSVPANATLVPLDPNRANEGTDIVAPSTGKDYEAGEYFAPHLATAAQTSHQTVGSDQYAAALKYVSADYTSVIASLNAVRTNFQQTCPAVGLEMAEKIFAQNPTTTRDQIVILFTDGVPTVSLQANREYGESGNAEDKEEYWSGLAGARDAINKAYDLKDKGVQIYTIGTSALNADIPSAYGVKFATGATKQTINGEDFLRYVSSECAGAQATHDATTPGQGTASTADDDNTMLSSTILTVTGTDVTSASDYAQTSATGDFSVVFENIISNVSTPSVTLDDTAALKEVLSQYFDLNNVTAEDILVYVAPYAGTNSLGEHTFGTPVLASEAGFTLKVELEAANGRENIVVKVTGFDYSANYVRVDTETNQPMGYKIIVEVPVKAREGFWGGNNVPTNEYTTAIYDGAGQEVQSFPMPSVNIPVDPTITTVDQVVYYGQTGITGSDLYGSVAVDGKPVVYDSTQGTFVPANAEDAWMDDYASLNWTEKSSTLTTPVSGTEPSEHTFSVTLAPKLEGDVNLHADPSNMAGDSVPMTGSTASDTATVQVLVPLLTYQDTNIHLGDETTATYYAENNQTSDIKWINMEDPYGEDAGNFSTTASSISSEPQLTIAYTPVGKFDEDTSVEVTVYLGSEAVDSANITNISYFDWVACTSDLHDGYESVADDRSTDTICRHKGTTLTHEFTVHVIGGDNGMRTNKYATPVPGTTDQFKLSLEAYATGSNTTIQVTKPADIVLVLDHSASMRTPAGAPNILDKSSFYNADNKLDESELDKTLGAHIGYYIGHSKTTKSWFVMRYVAETDKWEGYSIPDTECFVNPDLAPNPDPYGTYTGTQHTQKLTWAHGQIDDNLIFYKTQYAMLYDALKVFIADLKASGVEHNVAIVGFAGQNTYGTRLYVCSEGENNGGYKSYTHALYNANTSQERREELYRLAMKNVQDADEYQELENIVEMINTNDSYTCPAAGLQLANEVYAANEVDLLERDRVVVLFTDGIPNRTNSCLGEGEVDANGTTVDMDYIYNDVVTKAYETKNTYGAKVYSISTTTLGAGANRDFLKYSSSDYPDASTYATPGTQLEATLKYTSEVGTDGDLSVPFESVTKEVSATTVNLNDTTIMMEILTDYVELANQKELELNVSVYKELYLGNGKWGEKIKLENSEAKEYYRLSSTPGSDRINVIEVLGYNYSDEYISDSPRTVNGEDYYGSRLLAEVQIKAREGFWGGNNVPTNEAATGLYANGQLVETFPIPEVNLPISPDIQVENQVVYYGESNLDASKLLTTITVNGVKVTYDPETGKFIPPAGMDWVDDYADLSWITGEEYSDLSSKISSTESGDYTFGVNMKPKYDGSGNPMGEAVPVEGISVEKTASVDVLVPVLTFEDSTIFLGDSVNEKYYNTTNRVGEIVWVNKDDPYGYDSEAYPTAPSKGFETEPELTVSYSPVNGEGEYFTKDTPVDVEVALKNGTVITGESYFVWESCSSNLHDQAEIPTNDRNGGTVMHKGTTESREFTIHVTGILTEDTVVIDFGLGVNISALLNDILPEGATVVGVDCADTIPAVFTNESPAYGVSDASRHATLTYQVVEGVQVLRYVLNSKDMELSGKEVFVYAVACAIDENTTRYYYSTVTVIPATTIYYEDDFLTYTYGAYEKVGQTEGENGVEDVYDWVEHDGGWTQDGAPIKDTQAEDRPGTSQVIADANNIYGYDQAYTGMTTYSNGSAMWTTVDANRYANASFSFWGTGFDVISLTNSDSGVILVRVTDTEAGTTTNYMVDTYYGYTYTADGKWEVSSDASDTLYQVPVMKVDMKTYSHYSVTIVASYGEFFDHGQNDGNGSYSFWLDAIRIYDPADDGAEDTVISGAYYEDGELMPDYDELRNLLIGVEAFGAVNNGTAIPGVVFIDAKKDLEGSTENPGDYTAAISDYTNYGPNNEVYLAPGQAVAFNLSAIAANQSVHIAMKSVGIFGTDGVGNNNGIADGEGKATVEIYGLDADGVRTDLVIGTEGLIETATDLYYNISSLGGKTVVIRNNGDSGIISITNIKTTTSAVALDGDVITVEPFSMNAAVAYINDSQQVPIQPEQTGSVAPKYAALSFEDDVMISVYYALNGLENVAAGDMGLITFTQEVADGTVDNADAIIPGAVYHTESGLYRVQTQGIAAKDLGNTVWFRVYVRLSDGSYLYSSLLHYSPVDYANTVLNGSGYPTGLKALVVSMLNYGAQAQLFFGCEADALVNSGLTAQQQALAESYRSDMVAPMQGADSSKLGVFAATEGAFSNIYPSVSFESSFAINYYFTPANQPEGELTLYYWDQAAYDAAQTLTAENATGVMVLTGEDEFHGAVSGIAAKNIDATYYVSAVYQANGETCCSGVLAYSLGAYCANQAAAGSDLAAATAVYGYYAKSYFQL